MALRSLTKMSSLCLMLMYTIWQGVRGNILVNTYSIMDLNMTLFPTYQNFHPDQLANIDEALSHFVKSQLMTFYNNTIYQFVNAGISITKTFPLLTANHCRYLKIGSSKTYKSHIFLNQRQRLTQKASSGTRILFSGHVVFQDTPVPDLESAQTDFIQIMSQLTLLLQYIKEQTPGTPELQNVTYIALSGLNISYQNTNSEPCSFIDVFPHTERMSRRNVVIGSTIGASSILIALSSFILFIWYRNKSRRRKDTIRKVYRIKHLSDDVDDESFVPSSSSDQRTCYASLCESGHTLDNITKNYERSSNGVEEEEKYDVLSNGMDDLFYIGDDHAYVFKPLEAFTTSSIDDNDNTKTIPTDFPLNFEDASSLLLRAATPLPSIADSDDDVGVNRIIEPSEGGPKNNINILDLNTHIGAFPSRIPIGSFLKTPYPYADTATLGSDNTSLNQSLTSGSTHIHPLDWSFKGSIHDGQSVDNTTMTETDMFIIHRQNTPLFSEQSEGDGETGDDRNNEVLKANDIAQADPAFGAGSIGSKQFVNDLVWLKQKLSKFEAQSNDDNSSSGSHSSDE